MAMQVGNLFELAEKQLQQEIASGKRKAKNIIYFEFNRITRKSEKIICPYSFNDVLKYAIKIRKWLDKYGKKGNILKQTNKKQWKKEANYKAGKIKNLT